jgi:type II secretory pathway pseudopilin PulG
MLSRRLHHRAEEGVGLVELLVVITLMSILGSVFVNGIVSGLRTTTQVQDRTYTLADLQKSAERLARDLRTADPVEGGTAGATGLQVRIYRNGQCFREIYRLIGTQLVRHTQGPLSPAPSGPTTPTNRTACTSPAATNPPPNGLPQQVLMDGLVAATPVFTYFDVNGNALNFAASPRPAENQIAVIRISLQRVQAGRAPLTVSTDVYLRNLIPSTQRLNA